MFRRRVFLPFAQKPERFPLGEVVVYDKAAPEKGGGEDLDIQVVKGYLFADFDLKDQCYPEFLLLYRRDFS